MKEIEIIDSNGNHKGLILITISNNKLQRQIITLILSILEELGCKIRNK